MAPDGAGNAFSIENPGSLETVQEKVRGLSAKMKDDIFIVLLPGRYPSQAPLRLGPEDSGNNGYYVRYKAHKPGSARISGGSVLSDWEEAGNGLYTTKWEGKAFRQLYVNGKRAVRARIPNLEDDQSYGPYFRTRDWDADTRSIRVAEDDFLPWKGLEEVEFVIKKHWGQNRMRIESFVEEGGDIRLFFSEPESSADPWTKGCCPGFDDSQTYFYENSLDLLDAPGEWFLDSEAGVLWYMPRPGENMEEAEVIAPMLEALVEIENASHISFEDLVFEHTTWLMPDSARNGIQAGWRRQYSRGFIPGGIQAVNAHHLHFSGNIIHHFGGAGIEFLHSTHDNLIEGNLITDVSANGIQVNINIENRTPPLDSACYRDSIINNYVLKTACEYTGNTGITATYVHDFVIENNEVGDLPYTGISVGWGWTDDTIGQYNNSIRYNDVHHVGQLHDDGGCIYMLSRSPGTVIKENYCHDMRKSEWTGNFTYGGICLDNGSSSILIEDNVIQYVEVYPMVAWNPPNHSNIFRNNFYTEWGRLKIREGNIVEENRAIVDEDWPARALEIMAAAGPRPPKPLVD